MRGAAAAMVLLVAGCAASPPPSPQPRPGASGAATQRATPIHLGVGELPAAPSSAGPPGTVVDGRYQVCLDDSGRVTKVTTQQSIAGADDAVAAALRTWSWFVVVTAEEPLRCFDQPVRLAVPGRSHVLHQAGSGVVVRLKAGPAPKPPAWMTAMYAHRLVEPVYKVCVGDDGEVQSVHAVSGVLGGDDMFATALRASSWDIVVGTLAQAPYCFGVPLRLTFGDAEMTENLPSIPEDPAAVRAIERGVSVIVRLKPLNQPMPHLPDLVKIQNRGKTINSVYRQCIAPDGSVASVTPLASVPGGDEAMMQTLRTWLYAVRGALTTNVCQFPRLTFEVGH